MPWYISDTTSVEMDKYFNDNFSWLCKDQLNESKSWHAFKYKLDEKYISQVLHIIDRLKCYTSKVNIKLQPDITEDKISAFIRGESITDDKRKSCLSVYSRMDVLPDGGVSSCKHFPEFTVGNLNNQSVKEIWNSSDMNKTRSILKGSNMAVCSKCNNFYLHGYKNNF